MPRITHLAAACALALCAQAAQAQQFSNVIVIGDSLSDGGNYSSTIGPAAGSFTTNPDPVAVELIAANYGITLTPSLIGNNGGWNFAWGGAPTGAPFGCVPSGLTPAGCQNGQTQLANYFARSGSVADPNALYSVWLGANNIFNILGGAAPVPPPAGGAIAGITTTITQNLQIIGALQAAGARYIVVYNLPDIGKTPFGISQGGAAAAQITQLINIYNDNFNAGLASLGNGIIPINTFALVNEVLANPGAYGFTNTTGTACNLAVLPNQSSLFCTPAAYVTPTADQDYVFADGVHPTGATHAILAQAVVATISAPGQVSLAAEIPLQVYDDNSNAINLALLENKVTGVEVGTSEGFFKLQFGNQDYDAQVNSPETKVDSTSLSGGFEYRYSEMWSFGAAATYGSTNGDQNIGNLDGGEILGSIFAAMNFGNGYINGILSYGSSSVDIKRYIPLGPATRTELGNADLSHSAFELGGGYLFGDTVRQGPYISLTWQNIDVNNYAELSGDSTAMHFDDFNRESFVTRIGYQLQGVFGGEHEFRPLLRIAYAGESRADAIQVTAGSTSMNGEFTMDGFKPSDNWVEAELGLSMKFTASASGYIGYRGRLNDDTQSSNEVSLGVDVKF